MPDYTIKSGTQSGSGIVRVQGGPTRVTAAALLPADAPKLLTDDARTSIETATKRYGAADHRVVVRRYAIR